MLSEPKHLSEDVDLQPRPLVGAPLVGALRMSTSGMCYHPRCQSRLMPVCASALRERKQAMREGRHAPLSARVGTRRLWQKCLISLLQGGFRVFRGVSLTGCLLVVVALIGLMGFAACASPTPTPTPKPTPTPTPAYPDTHLFLAEAPLELVGRLDADWRTDQGGFDISQNGPAIMHYGDLHNGGYVIPAENPATRALVYSFEEDSNGHSRNVAQFLRAIGYSASQANTIAVRHIDRAYTASQAACTTPSQASLASSLFDEYSTDDDLAEELILRVTWLGEDESAHWSIPWWTEIYAARDAKWVEETPCEVR